MEPLEIEMNYFNAHRSEFVDKNLGKFVLIRGEAAIGFYATQQEAYEAGVDRFGISPFLIREITVNEQMHEIPAYYLGLLHAGV